MLIRQAATQGDKTLITYLDEFCENPRQDGDNFGKMICWHRRYNLGDKHDYNDQHGFLQDTLSRMDIGKLLYRLLKEKHFDSLRLRYDQGEEAWTLESYWDFSKQWYQEETYGSELSEDDLPRLFQDDVLMHLTETEMIDILNCRDDFVMLPLYLYDHSGIAVNTAGFSCPWDSGMVGWTYADCKMIREEFGNVNAGTIEQARKRLSAEVKTYDLYLAGQCYGYRCYDGESEVDGNGSYLGEYEDFVKDLDSELPVEFKHLVGELSDCNMPDIANYFWRIRHAS